MSNQSRDAWELGLAGPAHPNAVADVVAQVEFEEVVVDEVDLNQKHNQFLLK